MKSILIIEAGLTKIHLKPENDFEKDIIEKMVTKKEKFNESTSFNTDCHYGDHSNHSIIISITETK